ncbi:MAG: TonB C-terminal domain-containing protein [Polyangiaceae bacterium]
MESRAPTSKKRPSTLRPPKKLAWRVGYEGDEVAFGVALALALHVIPLGAIAIKVAYPSKPDPLDEPVVTKPFVAATLLKLGKPVDPKHLPDRLVPQRRTAPKNETIASREEPSKVNPKDAGPPPPNTDDSDLTKLIAKSDPFAEDAGKVRPEEGHETGVAGGTETDPTKVKAGEQYAARLGAWLHDRWVYPTVISQGEANRLCVVFQVSVSPRMVIWHVRQEPVKKSGNELFDDSARSMFMKLLDERTNLPEPPPEVAEAFKGRSVQIALSGDLHGDSSRCR